MSVSISNLYPSNTNITTFGIENSIMVNQNIFYANISIIVYDVLGKIILNKVLTNNSEKIALPANIKMGIYAYVIKSKDII
jgi:hypothetical protein